MNLHKAAKTSLRLRLLYFVYAIILLLAATAATYSRFVLTSAEGERARIAKPVIQFVQSSPPQLGELAPGETETYSFQIVNFDGSNVNEVTLDYYFEFAFENITAEELLDIDYDLYYQTSENSPVQHLGMTAKSPNRSNTLRISPGVASEHLFYLEITWNTSQRSYEYASKVNRFSISTFAEQVN